jgi:hypothetical protein
MSRPDLGELKKKWRNDLFSTDQWDKVRDQTFDPGESLGFRVKQDSVHGYLKPTKLCDEKNPRAAHEKIAADLAADLGLPVPPVLLYRRPNAPMGEENRCCVSLLMYPDRQYPWGFIFRPDNTVRTDVQAIVGNDTAAWLAGYSGMHVFHLWVGQVDGNYGSNVILGVDPERTPTNELLFIDYATALNQENAWGATKDKQKLSMVPIPEVFRAALSKTLLKEAADKIAMLPSETVTRIVGRIPADYMTEAHKKIVQSVLIARQSAIQDFVKQL